VHVKINIPKEGRRKGNGQKKVQFSISLWVLLLNFVLLLHPPSPSYQQIPFDFAVMGVSVAGRQKKFGHREPSTKKVAIKRVPPYVDVVAGGVSGAFIGLLIH
jgi:hypothetical protein